MRIATWSSDGLLRTGLLADGLLVDAARAAAAAEVELDADAHAGVGTRALLAVAGDARARLGEAAAALAGRGDGIPIEEARLGPPVPDPQKVLCVGLNYRAHVDEFGVEAPAAPELFAKFASSLVGCGEAIVVPPAAGAQVDFEGELAIVVGRRCKDLRVEDAADAIAGCMPFNDVTARELQFRSSQWTAGKAIDTFGPCGPALVTIDELGDLQDLRITTRVNGALVQDASTALMIFPIAELLAYASSLMTLLPGDVIATGTPAGVGFRREPPLYLAHGDVVEVSVEGVGTLVNPVLAAGDAAAAGAATGAQGAMRWS